MRPIGGTGLLYGNGMLLCGYAAGLRMGLRGGDWTHLPWWSDLIFGVAILLIAFYADRKESVRP